MKKEMAVHRPLTLINRSAWLKRAWVVFVFFCVIMAIVMTGLRAITPWINQHKTEVEHQLSLLLGETVSIAQMETGWYWFQPILALKGVLVSEKGHPVLQLDQLLVGVNLLSSLYYWQIQPGILMIDQVQLTLRETDQGWKVDGIHQGAQTLNAFSLDSLMPLVRWVLLQNKVKIKHVSAKIYLKDGTLLWVPSLTFKAIHHRGRYRIKSIVHLGKEGETRLLLEGDISFISDLLETTEGEFYFSVKNLSFSPFMRFLKTLPYYVTKGRGDLQAWISVQNGHISSLQSSIVAQNFEWHKQTHSSIQWVQKLTANLAWKPTPQGGQWSGDHLVFQTREKTWFDNAFVLDYQRASDRYRLYLKFLTLDSFLWSLLDWPNPMKTWLNLHPRGNLDHVQIGFSRGIIDYFLARFSEFGWDASPGFPGVQGLSGALHWEPLKGRLELDSQNVKTIWPNREHSLLWDHLGLAVEWKALSEGVRVALERLSANHPHLSLSAKGVLDHYKGGHSGDLQLNADFSSQHAEFWLPYFPKMPSKPKLEHWLKKEIDHIDEMSGSVVVKGPLIDFPFDKDADQGTFLIQSTLKGVDLQFHPAWPRAKKMAGLLNIEKRSLHSEIAAALAPHLETQSLDLKISGLGSGQDRMFVSGKIQADASSMMDYVLKTPLKDKLSRLSVLHLQHPLDLDVSLEIPLTDGQEELKVSGSLLFDENKANLSIGQQTVPLTHLLGTLFFNEKGVVDSALSAHILEQPVRMDLKGIEEPSSMTQIKITGDFPWSSLRKQWPTVPLMFFQGHLPLQLVLELTNNPAVWDKLSLSSTLEGTGIALPEPYGKRADIPALSQMEIAFNWKKGIHFQGHLGDRTHADLWFADEKKEFEPLRGVVCLGCSSAVSTQETGILLKANMEGTTDFSLWQPWLQNILSQSGKKETSTLRRIALHFSKFKWFDHVFEDIDIQSEVSTSQKWNVVIKQHKKIWAQLEVDWANEKISGRIDHVVIPDKNSKHKSVRIQGSPKSWPNLDLAIDHLLLGDKRLGACVVRGSKESNAWRINELQVTAEPYQFNASGLWSGRKNDQKTTLNATLNIKKLSLLLDQWGVPPVVESKGGTISFEGGWSDALMNFSLKQAEGNLYIAFKEGRITHFDRETEQKLGLGKLLSILSLQTIPRRLKLDFSDLAKDGYSFDYFKGHFKLQNGSMFTEDSMIDGPVAYASIKGSLNLIQRLYDLDLRVMPHITASLPVVASIAGSPIAGVAIWVASKVLASGMDKVSGYTYTITGPWFNPIVQQVHIYRKKKSN